jgi:hypothetical protein
MNMTTIRQFKANYERIVALIPNIENMKPGDAGKLTAGGFMDLHYDTLARRPNRLDIALAHYYKQNGDSVPDPDMRIWLDLEKKMALPMAMQDFLGYRECIDENDRVRTKELDRQSAFLSQWLRNLKAQGHTLANHEAA